MKLDRSIDTVMADIMTVHKKYPELRLIQILDSCWEHGRDPYYLENSDVIKALKDTHPEVFDDD